MKSSVFLSKPTEELYQRAKEYNPEYSLSDATKDGLRMYVEKMDAQVKGMLEVVILGGSEDRADGSVYGSYLKFVGKEIAKAERQVGNDEYETETLYLTKKGNFLIQRRVEETGVSILKWSFDPCHSVKELREKASPELIRKAGKPGEFVEELDI